MSSLFKTNSCTAPGPRCVRAMPAAMRPSPRVATEPRITALQDMAAGTGRPGGEGSVLHLKSAPYLLSTHKIASLHYRL